MACRTLVPRPGIKSMSPGFEASVLTAGPIRKSFNKNFFLSCQISLAVSRAANNISSLLTKSQVKEGKVSRFSQAGPCGAFQGQTPPHVLHLPLVCNKNFSLQGLLQVLKNEFNQRCEKMQKERKTVKGDETIVIMYSLKK